MHPPSNLTFGYGSGTFNPADKSAQQPFHCSYGKATREPGTFREECIAVAKLLAASTDRPIAVCLSGGLDSEVVLRSFLDAGIPVEAWTVQIPDASDHEIAFVEQTCKILGVETNFLELPAKWLESSEANSMFFKAHAYYLEMLPHMVLLNHLHEKGYYPVMGNGEVLLEQKTVGDWVYTELEYDLAWYRHCHANNIPAACGFFQQTPEIQLAALKHKRVVDVVTGRNKLSRILKTTRPVKYIMYRDEWPDIVIREKFDGFENLREFSNKRRAILNRSMKQKYNDTFHVPYADMLKLLELQDPLPQFPST